MTVDSVFIAFLVSCGSLFLGINCISLGLISPIEVVEEWGCHDTEIRLTCGHLDSKLAILEATFTPNCTQEDCLRLDVKRLARVFSVPKYIDPRVAEAEAGRKFLETLRKTHTDDEDADDLDEGEGGDVGETKGEDTRGNPRADRLLGQKARKASLKASLERLIIRYLRKLAPNEDLDFHVKRSARSKRDSPYNRTVSMSSDIERVVLGERNITINESTLNRVDGGEEQYRMVQESRSVCMEQKRKVSSLDRLDIEHSYKNESEEEYNIRKILNRRCSGRNHCSFLFAIDHPFSKVWDSGVVRVKYICMDDFRINQYCSEHLTIGYEVASELDLADVEPTMGEPVAEARVQPQDQSYHSLKILKTSDDAEMLPDILNSAFRKRKIKLQKPQIEEIKKENSGIYSQDFKILKILPNDLDDFNDIEQIGDEIYIRTNDEILKSPEPTLPTQTRLTTRQAVYSATQNNERLSFLQSTSGYFESLEDYTRLPEASQNLSKFENITMIIREGEQYIITFPSPRILDNISVNASVTTPHPTSISVLVNISTVEGSLAASTPTESSFETATINEPEDEDSFSTTRQLQVENRPQTVPTPDDLSAEGTDNKYKGVDSDSNNRFMELPESFYDDEDDSEEKDQDNSERKSYFSIQRTFYGRPLLHGFAMSPGYPKFYIGDYNCKWMISAPIGQKIRVTILDLSLRYDCKDFVEFIDLEIGRTLYNSCSESVRPVEIISDSNQIEVIMKSSTKFAYPKRGFLLHYSALGCVNPPLPRNVRLVNRTEITAFYECDLSYVFPDSGVNTRRLVCTERHTWDRILPDCVGVPHTKGSLIKN